MTSLTLFWLGFVPGFPCSLVTLFVDRIFAYSARKKLAEKRQEFCQGENMAIRFKIGLLLCGSIVILGFVEYSFVFRT